MLDEKRQGKSSGVGVSEPAMNKLDVLRLVAQFFWTVVSSFVK